ncbi:MAG: hypothetical protein ACI8PB_002817 [Desulforhopalus sp.]|jgi:hypothetical protein
MAHTERTALLDGAEILNVFSRYTVLLSGVLLCEMFLFSGLVNTKVVSTHGLSGNGATSGGIFS